MNTYTHKYAQRSITSRTLVSGFSMIEMMVSITIGLMIIAALVAVLAGASGNTKTNDRTSELQSNGRFALDHLKRELRHAGYRGYTAKAPVSTSLVTPVISGECGTAGSFVKNIRQAVWGANDNNPFNANCIPATSYLTGDVLVIRHADDAPITAANATPSTIYLRSTYGLASLLQGSAVPAAVTIGTENFALLEYVYYISPFTNSIATTGIATENPQVPALYRIALQADGSMTPELVVSGIEQFQVEYGFATRIGELQSTQYFPANSINGGHSATGATSWDSISSVRIWLLARNAKPETGYSNTETYTLSTALTPKSDSFRRQVFTTVVQLRNFRN